jgi:xanthine dehydrogenase accessory factor
LPTVGVAAPAAVLRTCQALGRPCAAIALPVELASRATQAMVDDALEFGMACHSGGTLELFVDPMLPPARLTVIGDSPVAVALAGLAPRVGLQVTVIAHGADAQRFADAAQVVATDDAAAVAARVAPGSFVVVTSQNQRDMQPAAARHKPPEFVVASAPGAGAREVIEPAPMRKPCARSSHRHASSSARGRPEIALSVLRRRASRGGGKRAPIAVQSAVPLPDPAPVAGSCCGAGGRHRGRDACKRRDRPLWPGGGSPALRRLNMDACSRPMACTAARRWARCYSPPRRDQLAS